MSSNPTLTQEDLGKLHTGEVALLYMLRTKYRWGKVEIEVADGVPVFLSRTIERDKLGVMELSTAVPQITIITTEL
jgi:hypothetical protein